MRAELLAVGSELLTPLRYDTNALYMTERLAEVGVLVGARVTVADDAALLESAFRTALQRADLVVATGGLGPTEDDLTREAAAAALGRGLARDAAYLEALKERFARYLRPMAKTNEKQADLIEGASFIKNPRGTAPGQWIESAGKLLVLLPGPPVEMKPMFDEDVLPRVRERAGNRLLRRRILKIASMSESDVDQALAPLYRTFLNPRTTILSAPGQVELHLTAEGADEAEAEAHLEKLAAGMRALLPGRFFTEDNLELPAVVGALLRARSLRLALAESCTGGLLGARLTEVPGASLFFERSFVTYSNRSKVEELGVSEQLLERHGAVSEEVAAALAAGARAAASVEVGVGITGVAGPDGGTPDKPVGLVFVATDGAAGTRVRRALFPGNRERIRYQATQAALEMLRRGLLGLSPLA
ncbi:MAG TPA: competence/damage-inducible protein A [Vicinamibacteria bacterium]